MIGTSTLDRTEMQSRALDEMPPRVRLALSHFCDALLARFPGEIRRIILYGSFARGEAHADSDVDVMVVVGWKFEELPGGFFRSPYSDPSWRAIVDLSVEATLESEREVAPLVFSEEMFFHKTMDVAREAQREGIELYAYPTGITPAGKALATLADKPDERLAVNRAIREGDASKGYEAASPDLNAPVLWLNSALEKLQVARELSDAGHYDDAISRAYYGMFYAAKAMLLSIGVITKSHAGTNSEVGKHFVKTGRLGVEYQAMLSRAGRARQRSDYELASRPDQQSAEGMICDAAAFIAKARELVEEELSRRGGSLA